ncbi:MAG TPA: M20/M25/M40 family metallo-hydrolase [Streptosporangiaceae bacterium]
MDFAADHKTTAVWARSRDAEPEETLYRIVEISSVTGEETELASYLVKRMASLGMKARRDEAGNVLGEAGDPDGPTIMLLGHMDTVPGGPAVRLHDGVLHGRGTVDAKGPLATMIFAAARARLAGAHVVVAGAVGEEGLSPGARHLLSGPAPDAVVIGEPSGVDGVVLGYKGIIRLTLDVARPPAHTSAPADKAVELAADYWHDLREHLARRYPSGPMFGRAVPALVGLDGDITRARATISCRLPPGFDSAAFRAWLADRASGGTVTVTEDLPAVRSARTDPVVRALSAAVRRSGRRPVAKVRLGTSDMNVVAPAWSVPAAAYGPGNSRLAHSDDERLALADYLAAIEVLADAVRALAGALTRRRTQP